MELTLQQLHAVEPRAHADMLAPLNEAIRLAEADSPLRTSAMAAQLIHESSGLTKVVEVWGPTPAQQRYEGSIRLGNTQPGDGYLFRGRGALELTGRGNYARASVDLGIDLVANPDLAADPSIWPKVAAWYWRGHGCNRLADDGDFIKITEAVNGGLTGIVSRQTYYAKLLDILGAVLVCAQPDTQEVP